MFTNTVIVSPDTETAGTEMSQITWVYPKWASVSINYYRLLSPCHFGVSLLGVKETHT